MRPQERLSKRPRMLFVRTKPLFSIKDAAAYLGMAEGTLRRRIAAGHLPAYPWGRRRLLWRADLDQYLRQAGAWDVCADEHLCRASGG